MKNRLAGASFGLALLAVIYLLVRPIYAGFNGTQPTRGTLLQVNGPYILIPVMFPVLTALIALLLRKQGVRVVATILIGLFAVIGGFTIGLFYLPAGVLMLLASCVDDSSKFRDPL
jgi:ABC-type transport system involved in multi-copper enzyme maturation permease subunit